MNRREFLAGSAALAAAGAGGAQPPNAGMKLCMNEATSMSADYRRAMEGYGRAGFRYVEPWINKIDEFAARESLAVAKRVLADNGLTPVCSCAQGGIAEPLPEAEQAKAFDQLKHKLEVCSQVGIPRLNVHSIGTQKYKAEDYDGAVERLRRAGDMARAAGVVITLEFIRGTTFLCSLSTSVPLVRRVNHPNIRVMFDLFHLWGGYSKFEDLELLRQGEPEHVHLDDVPAGIPREILTDRDRVPPGEGVIPIVKILKALARNRYQGALSIELFHQRFQQGDPYEVALQLRHGAESLLEKV